MLPKQGRVDATLSGMNVAYKREVLKEVESAFHDGFHETSMHEELRREGHDLYLAPSAIAYLSKNYEFGEILRTYFHLGRSFAGRRVAGARPVKRALFALGACLLPILLSLRTVIRTIPKRRHVKKLFLWLPYLLSFTATGSSGEVWGCLCGVWSTST